MLPVGTSTYVGWIPTALGSLSFRLIGETDHPTVATTANVVLHLGAGKNRRLVVTYQRRDLSDTKFKHIPWFSEDTAMWFCLFLDDRELTNASSFRTELIGKAFCFVATDHWIKPVAGSKTFKTEINEIIDSLRSASFERLHDQSYLDKFYSLMSDACRVADLSVDVRILRSGIVEFSRPVFISDDLESGSIDAGSERRVDIYHWIANQFYYFLKDVCHRHQHHSPSSDSVLTVQEYDSDGAWKYKIPYSLQHFAIDSKRSALVSAQTRAIGILAYRDAFVSVVGLKIGRDIPDAHNLIVSMTAKWNGDNGSTGLKSFLNSKISVVFAWLTLCIAFLAIFVQPEFTPKLQEDHYLHNFRSLLLSNIPLLASILVVFALIPVLFRWVVTSENVNRRFFEIYKDCVTWLQFRARNGVKVWRIHIKRKGFVWLIGVPALGTNFFIIGLYIWAVFFR